MNDRAERIFAGIHARIETDDPPVFEPPEPEAAGLEDDDALYDSTRGYNEQLERYKAERGR